MASVALNDQSVNHLPRATHPKPPWLLAQRSSKTFVVFVVSYAIFADQFVFAIVVPVMPFALRDRVGIREDSVQYWVSVLLALYGAATTIASPIWGWYADRHASRRIPFLVGLAAIACATVVIWLSRHIVLQAAGRILQGLAAAVVWVTGLAMIADNVEEENIGQYVGYLSFAMMIGMLIAPLLGGVILAKAGYNAVFGLALGLIGIDIILRLLVVERATATISLARSDDDRSERIQQDDPEQSRTMNAVEEKEPDVEGRPVTMDASWKMKVPAVIRLLSSRRICVALLAAFTIGTIFAGFQTVLPLHVHEAFGWDSVGAGLIFLPLTLPSFLGPVVGWLCDRYGPKWPMTAGFLSLCPIMTLLRYTQDNTLHQKVILCVLLTLAACCFTVTLNPVMAEVAYVVTVKAKTNPRVYGGAGGRAYAQAFGLFNTTYSLGNTVGPVIAGLIRDAAGWATMSWVLGLIGGLTAIPVALWTGTGTPTVL